jgi:XTP/dITP diphosphohydrolase
LTYAESAPLLTLGSSLVIQLSSFVMAVSSTTPSKPVLVLGTHNLKKRAELSELLEPLGLELRTLADFPNALEVDETGETFAENAQLKAIQQARHLKYWVLGEDSGLAVDALKGAPGIYSARFYGPDATDQNNNRHLLEQLSGLPAEKRSAHYVCHMTLSDSGGNVRAESEARCHGRILTEGIGSGGFGYDPLFEVSEYHRTFGQMGGAAKAVLSHRARAMRLLVPQIASLVAKGEWK